MVVPVSSLISTVAKHACFSFTDGIQKVLKEKQGIAVPFPLLTLSTKGNKNEPRRSCALPRRLSSRDFPIVSSIGAVPQVSRSSRVRPRFVYAASIAETIPLHLEDDFDDDKEEDVEKPKENEQEEKDEEQEEKDEEQEEKDEEQEAKEEEEEREEDDDIVPRRGLRRRS
ncbi:hypothetical protein M0802_000047 [Mischocyttarus mexicanus]|nr:hypothetical protein M0802_000047 [Mischocyttarus mexicanus]